MTNVLSDLLKLVGSLTPIFGGFLYYVGRRFIESYYETLGVPHEALSFSVADYLFKSMQSWMFLIALALTYLLFILWHSVFKKPESMLEIPKQAPKKKGKSNVFINIGRTILRVFMQKKGAPFLFGIILFFYSIFTLALLIMWILPRAEPNFAAEAFSEIMMLVFAIGLGWLIMTDKPTIDFVRERKWLAKMFIASIVFTVIISMQLLPHGIGRFAGIIQTNPHRIEQAFPSVTVISNKPLWNQDIGWVELDGIYETKNRLILILQNNEGVFVKRVIEEEISEIFKIKRVSDTYYIPNSNIEGLYINILGKFPKVEEN